MPKKPACQGMHKFFLVEEWNAMGAVVTCLNCDRTFNFDQNVIEVYYLPFVHTSGTEGPAGDRELLVLARALV
jgi:hypothetical protein